MVVASRQLVCDIVDFHVHQTAHLPSDHAPVTLEMLLPRVNLPVLDMRVSMLGGHDSLMGGARRPISFSAINHDVFVTCIPPP